MKAPLHRPILRSPPVNRESYDAIAVRWEQARVRLSEAERRLLALACDGLAPGSAVLDLGCGTGRPVAEHLVQRGLRIIGVDQSVQMLDVARRLLPDQQWILDTLESFVPSGRFAAVVAWDSVFHVPRAAHAPLFERVRAALDAGGRVALTVGGSAHPAFTDTMFERKFFYDSHPPEVAVALLRSARFEIVHTEFLNPPTAGRDKGRFAIVASAA